LTSSIGIRPLMISTVVGTAPLVAATAVYAQIRARPTS